MTWILLGDIDLNNQSNWEYSSIFPISTQVVKCIHTLSIQGTFVSPENVNIRGLLTFAENSNGIISHLENKIIFPSNVDILYNVPIHPFQSPRIGLKLLGDRYNKFNPNWRFSCYYWDGEINPQRSFSYNLVLG